ncbi:unnamed protein product, partial [Rotaria magnacalcarata]
MKRNIFSLFRHAKINLSNRCNKQQQQQQQQQRSIQTSTDHFASVEEVIV